MASHDLQSRCAKVASVLTSCWKRYGDQLDRRGIQYIDFAVDGAKRMQILINDLLTFSRVGRLQRNPDRVDLSTTLEQGDLECRHRGRGVGAQIDRPDECRPLQATTLLIMLWQT